MTGGSSRISVGDFDFEIWTQADLSGIAYSLDLAVVGLR